VRRLHAADRVLGLDRRVGHRAVVRTFESWPMKR
jgi:hypothetical protein